jgi:hypothetical protein
MTESPRPRIEFVSQHTLNLAFESTLAHYVQHQIQLESKISRANAPNPRYNQPPGTRSVLEKPIHPDSGQTVAIVHDYLLADGKTIGASGKKYPKRVIWEDVDYRVRNPSSEPHG